MFDIYAFWHLWCCYNIFFHNYSKTRDKQILLCWVMMWLLTKPEQKLVGLWLTMSEMALISDWWEFEPHYCDTETKTRSTMNNRIYLCKISPCNNFFLPFYLKLPVEILSLSAHQNRVSDMVFSLESEWLVSTGHDKSVSWMCTQSGSMLGRHYFNAWASCLQYPSVWDIQFQLWALSLRQMYFLTSTSFWSPDSLPQIRSRHTARLCGWLLRTDHAAETGKADLLHHHHPEGSRR